MPDLEDFHITFGQKTAREPHPASRRIRPDTFITVSAHNYDVAKLIADYWFGENYSMIYKGSEHDLNYFPGGEVGRIEQRPALMEAIHAVREAERAKNAAPSDDTQEQG